MFFVFYAVKVKQITESKYRIKRHSYRAYLSVISISKIHEIPCSTKLRNN